MVYFILWNGMNVYLHVGRQWRWGGGGKCGRRGGRGGRGGEGGKREKGIRRVRG